MVEEVGYLDCALNIDGGEDILALGDLSDDLAQLCLCKSPQDFMGLVPSVLENGLIAQGGGIQDTLPFYPGDDLGSEDISWRGAQLHLCSVEGAVLDWEQLSDPQ